MSSQIPPNLETQIIGLTERDPCGTGSMEGGGRSYLHVVGPCLPAGHRDSQGCLPGQPGSACQLHSSFKYLSQAG